MSETRGLVLMGPPASGKSTLAPRLAAALGWRVIDLDAAVEAEAGRTVAAVFAEEGEAGFRRRERAALDRALTEDRVVIAAGGGALVQDALRRSVLRTHWVVGVSTPRDVLVSRIQSSSSRPLVEGDAERKLDALLAARGEGYAEVHFSVAGTGDLDARVAEVVARVKGRRRPWVVPLGARSHRVYLGPLAAMPSVMAEEGIGAVPLVLTDRRVEAAQKASLASLTGALGASLLALPPGEKTKRLATLPRVWSALLARGADRRAVLACVGGGVVTDLGGLASALYLRGIGYVSAPTTLLAMADASVGGKTAVDLPEGKNLVGAFHQPRMVYLDPDTLDTLAPRDYTAGLAEVIKMGLAVDEALLTQLEDGRDWEARPRSRQWAAGRAAREAMIAGAVLAKIDVVSEDERESGRRAVLNFGHTMGHAVEQASGFRLRHGEAVAIGIAAALDLGVALGITPTELRERGLALLSRAGLPRRARVPFEHAWEALIHDKKRDARGLNFVLLRGPGAAEVMRVDEAKVRAALTAALENG